jgi:hypothetical protein
MTIAQSRTLSAILCADWGKDVAKRAVYVAEIESRLVRRLPTAGWSLVKVLKEAGRWTSTGSVLATFDAPFGVPESYVRAVGRLHTAPPIATFLDVLTWARSVPRFYDATTVARDWRVASVSTTCRTRSRAWTTSPASTPPGVVAASAR